MKQTMPDVELTPQIISCNTCFVTGVVIVITVQRFKGNICFYISCLLSIHHKPDTPLIYLKDIAVLGTDGSSLLFQLPCTKN